MLNIGGLEGAEGVVEDYVYLPSVGTMANNMPY